MEVLTTSSSLVDRLARMDPARPRQDRAAIERAVGAYLKGLGPRRRRLVWVEDARSGFRHVAEQAHTGGLASAALTRLDYVWYLTRFLILISVCGGFGAFAASAPLGFFASWLSAGAAAVLTPAFGQYVRAELGYRTDVQYRLLNRDISGRWDFGTTPTRQGFAGSLDVLQKARTQNPSLGVLISQGYTDLVTPYSVSRYLVDQLPTIASATPIEFRLYRGGHMMYLRPASRCTLHQDARAFYGRVPGAP